ncbi:uncharacterized protein I303_100334 [Kwoniella dejecticola CBS 10117]|uniref:HNH nuclease domain-containing protein n=1 Tax=Kwoniella dejecticola CBS 10117 TaxID=1296121 RepID=A0AAJ8MDJ1_9TREE
MYTTLVLLLLFTITIPITTRRTVQARHNVTLPYNPSRRLLPLEPYPVEHRQDQLGRRSNEGRLGRRMYPQDEISGWSSAEKEKRQSKWDKQIEYSGKTFFDGWEFFTQPDPTYGLVTYVDNSTAFKNGLAFWTGDGKPGIQVDHFSNLPVGTP